MEAQDLKLDLADPASIQERLPEIEKIVEMKRVAANAAEREHETWDTLLKRLRMVAGLVIRIEQPVGNPPLPSPAAEDAVVRVAERLGVPVMAVKVEEALQAEGHEVESRAAVRAILSAAVAAGRLQQTGPRQYAAPSSGPAIGGGRRTPRSVPEAHFGLDGPPPQSKAEAAVRVLASDPTRLWSTADVRKVMVAHSWMGDSPGDLASLSSTLSRLFGEGKIHRPERGKYRLSPSAEGDA